MCWSAQDRHAPQIAGDVLLVRLNRTSANLQQFRVAPQPLDMVLADVAVPTQHLDGTVRDVLALVAQNNFTPSESMRLP